MKPLAGQAGPLFELDGAVFAAGSRTLLGPLSLSLPPRRVIGLIGHNGSGKSTLVKLLARQHSPTAGSLLLDGRPVGTWSGRAFARKVAYLPQSTPPASAMLVRELVALGRHPWHGALGRFGALDRAKVEEAIGLTGVAPLADRLVDSLSGGERQRAWLAMLVAQDTECLLLDEPTSALDIAHQIETLSLVRRLSREKGIGVVLVLHDVNMAARFCDELIALHSGRVIARGTPQAIMTPAVLERIYGVAMEILPHPRLDHPVALVC